MNCGNHRLFTTYTVCQNSNGNECTLYVASICYVNMKYTNNVAFVYRWLRQALCEKRAVIIEPAENTQTNFTPKNYF